MTRIDSTKVKWRVQVRRSRAHKWVNKGLFETREAARLEAWNLRYRFIKGTYDVPGFGNTRTVRHISGKGKAS